MDATNLEAKARAGSAISKSAYTPACPPTATVPDGALDKTAADDVVAGAAFDGPFAISAEITLPPGPDPTNKEMSKPASRANFLANGEAKTLSPEDTADGVGVAMVLVPEVGAAGADVEAVPLGVGAGACAFASTKSLKAGTSDASVTVTIIG